MSRRSRPHYHSGLEWILGVAFEDTLTRPARLAQGFTHVRCCGSPRASSPHGLSAPALASHDGRDCVQLPPARGCYHLAPRRTFTSNPVPMPGTPSSLRSSQRRSRSIGGRWWEGANGGGIKAPSKPFSKFLQKSRVLLQAFPKKSLAVLWDFKGLQGFQTSFDAFQIFLLQPPLFGRIFDAAGPHSGTSLGPRPAVRLILRCSSVDDAFIAEPRSR